MQGFRRITLALALAGAALAAPAAASAQTKLGKCPQGDPKATCELTTGKVTFVGDGDTISVDLAGDGTKKPVRVRITGIQAMEETYYTNVDADRAGECHGNEAADRLQAILKSAKNKVQLAAQNPDSHSGSRLRRAVSIKIHRNWRDVGRIMIKEGQALWLPNGSEWAYNSAYSTIAEQAAARRQNIWNPEFCGFGPPATVRLWANSDAEGADGQNVNGEWIRIKNIDTVNPLPLGGWWVRDSGLRRYTFPPTATVAPGAETTVYVGRGSDSPPGGFFWGLRKPIFDNASSERAIGDGAYLFDPQGDLRAYMQYPCRYHCSDPLKGKVSIDAHYKPSKEYVTFRNTSGEPMDLEGYRVLSRPHSYVFGPDSVVQPGEQMRVDVRGDPADNTRLRKGWDLPAPILSSAGDKVALVTLSYIQVACTAWGSKSC
jgi:endonuclease YncB( thermonuclease family)